MRSPVNCRRDNSLTPLIRVAVCVSAIAVPLPALAQGAAVAVPARSPVIAAAAIPGTPAAISRVALGAETLHVVVGHSVFLNTKMRLRRVYVTDPAMLSSFTLSPNQIIVTAMLPGTSSLIVQDETGQAQSYVVSSDLDVEGLRTAMSEAMREDVVRVEGSGSRVILSGTVSSDALADTAVKLATLYSKDVANSLTVIPAHVKQVRLKVRILEVDRSKLTQFGINLFNPAGSYAGNATTGQFPTTATVTPATTSGGSSTLTVSDPLNFLLYDWKYNVGATIKDLETKQILQILAEPTITTISGQKANFLAGGEFPFPVIQPGGGSGTSASVTIQFRPYGVKLEFTPQVNEDGTIRLKVAPEVSALDYTNSVSISGYTIPAISTRRAETQVELRSDQSFAISGLLDKRTTDAYNRTPGIASVPIIGQLFKSKSINRTNTELIVIVTPTTVDPLTDATEPPMPKFPVQPLNPGSFDKSVSKGATAAAALETTPLSVSGATPALASGTAPAPASSPTTPAPPAVALADQSSSETAAPQPVTISTSMPSSPVVATAITIEHSKTDLEVDATAASVRAIPAPPPHVSMVQVMAISHKEDADSIINALKRKGYDVAVRQDPRDQLIHLQVGPFASTADAETMRQRLVVEGYNATIQ